MNLVSLFGQRGYSTGAACALAVLMTGCGSSSGSTESTSSLTKAQFLKQGNAICARAAKNKSYSMGIDYGLVKCWLG